MAPPFLTPLDLAQFIHQAGIAADLIPMAVDTPTAPAAAAALGVTRAQIIKSLLFEIHGALLMVISAGDVQVDRRALAARLGVGKKQIKLAASETVLRCLGYPVGGVPPFGHATRVPILLDRSVAREEVIYGGGGDDRTMLRLTPTELQRATAGVWVDLTAALPMPEEMP